MEIPEGSKVLNASADNTPETAASSDVANKPSPKESSSATSSVEPRSSSGKSCSTCLIIALLGCIALLLFVLIIVLADKPASDTNHQTSSPAAAVSPQASDADSQQVSSPAAVESPQASDTDSKQVILPAVADSDYLHQDVAKAYLDVINKLEADYGPLQTRTKLDHSDEGSVQTNEYYYGLCGGYVAELGSSPVPELIVAVSRKAEEGYGIDTSEIFVYSYNGAAAAKVGEMRVQASGNGRSWPEFYLHELNGKGYLEERWNHLPSFNHETNEMEQSPSDSKFHIFSGSALIAAEKPSYDGSTVLIGSSDNILINNLAELKEMLEKYAPQDKESSSVAASGEDSFSKENLEKLLQADLKKTTVSAGPAPDKLIEGASVFFGKYPQNSGDSPEPIEWQVLEADGQTALLYSCNCLDCKTFHHSALSSWRECDLRSWLNDQFLNKAFSPEERERIAQSSITTRANGKYGTAGCGETSDKIFCLSLDEVKRFFPSNADRKCWPTSYAKSRNAYSYDDTGGSSCYWLRSPGRNSSRAAYVRNDGVPDEYGDDAWDGIFAVRPALRIKI